MAQSFEALPVLERQRLVHWALKALWKAQRGRDGQEGLSSSAIHSLPSLQTLTPQQWQALQDGLEAPASASRPKVQFEDLDHNVVDLQRLASNGRRRS